jgi:CHASE1-domain containing sensor protein
MHRNVPLPKLPATLAALRHGVGPLVSYASAAMFTALLAATVGVWLLARTNAQDKAQTEFAAKADKIADMVQERLTDYEQALWGAARLTAAVPTLTREQSKAYVTPLSVRERLPGVQSVAFTKRVTPQERDAYIAAMRAQGFPDYTIWPEGVREEYTAITFSEPSDPANRRALGYDMFAEPVRHAAMAEARDTGQAVLSGKVKLVQQTGSAEQPGFLIFVPVYRDATPAETVEQRRAALVGYVFSPFRAGDFIATALQNTPETIGIEVYDDATIDKAALLYRSPSLAAFADPTAKFSYESITERALGRHQWTLRLVGVPGYIPATGQQASPALIRIMHGDVNLDPLRAHFFDCVADQALPQHNVMHRRQLCAAHQDALLFRWQRAEELIVDQIELHAVDVLGHCHIFYDIGDPPVDHEDG